MSVGFESYRERRVARASTSFGHQHTCQLKSEIIVFLWGVIANRTNKGQGWSYLGAGHAAVVKWDEVWSGRTWEDMPGGQADIQKMNFFLWRRGILRWISED